MQGFNMGRYVPPEHEGTISANKLAGKHALGVRARKSAQGILTVRFEMPFPIWCTTCPKPTIIGQGVRFNAEKKKVGNYYSTPIFSFRMKHVVCGGWMEIRTDPKNTAYVVTEGAKKRDTGEDKMREGDVRIMTEEERERLKNDAFAALEGKVEDKRQATTDRTRIAELHYSNEKDWVDPYAASRKLRRAFRADRKVRENNQVMAEDLKDRMSLGIDLLEETEEDRKRAGFVEFGDWGQNSNENLILLRAQSKPLFASTSPAAVIETSSDSKNQLVSVSTSTRVSKKSKTKLSRTQNPETQRMLLQQALSENTRVAIDPFLGDQGGSTISPSTSILRIKRKRDVPSNKSETTTTEMESQKKAAPLVDYDSD